jgi:hypothetical protein
MPERIAFFYFLGSTQTCLAVQRVASRDAEVGLDLRWRPSDRSDLQPRSPPTNSCGGGRSWLRTVPAGWTIMIGMISCTSIAAALFGWRWRKPSA